MLKKIASSLRKKFQALMRRGKDRVVKEEPVLTEDVDVNEETVAEQPTIQKKKKPRKRKPPWTLDNFQVAEEEGKVRFHDFSLPVPLMHGIADLKFQYCTPIQGKSLGPVLDKKDLIGKANTGTGKTAVFLIGTFSKLMADRKGGHGKRHPRALVLAPTRELVIQIVEDAKKLGKYSQLNVAAVYGGADYERQMELLQRQKTDIVVATPGRLIDFHNKRVVSLENCTTLVIDEADRMLDMGFIPDVRRIVSWTPKKRDRQTLLFSATISTEVQRLADQWCVDPEYVEAESDLVATDTVDQKVYLVTAEEKYHVLYNLIKGNRDERIIIFANMKSETKKLSERLKRNGIDCLLLSGDVAQNKRQSRLESFRNGQVKVLVATDVAGRGIHIDGISYVVNYTLPYEPEDYVHRIGRTGRAGVKGKSVSFACEEGAFYLPEIEEYIGEKLECEMPEEELVVPAPKGTVQKQSYNKKDGKKHNSYSGKKKSNYRGKKPQSKKPTHS